MTVLQLNCCVFSDLESDEEGSGGSDVEINAPKTKRRKKEDGSSETKDSHIPFTFKGKSNYSLFLLIASLFLYLLIFILPLLA